MAGDNDGDEASEGTPKDIREDKILAAQRGKTMKEWEASPEDERHDRQQSMAGLRAVQAPNRPK